MTPTRSSTPDYESGVESVIRDQRVRMSGHSADTLAGMSPDELAELDQQIAAAEAAYAAALGPLEAAEAERQKRDNDWAALVEAGQLAARKVDEARAAKAAAEREAEKRTLAALMADWEKDNHPQVLVDHSVALDDEAAAIQRDKYAWLQKDFRAIFGVEAPPRALWTSKDADTSWEITLYGTLHIVVYLHLDGSTAAVSPLWTFDASNPLFDLHPGPVVLVPGALHKLGGYIKANPAIATKIKGTWK